MTRRRKIALWVSAGVLVAGVILGRVIWGWVMESRYLSRLAAYRAAGVPTTMDDLAPPAAPDEENAAVLYEEAFAAIQALPDNVTRKMGHLPPFDRVMNAEERAEAEAILVDAKETLGLLRQGAEHNGFRFKARFTGWPYAVITPRLSPMVTARSLLRLSARCRAEGGHPDEAADEILVALRMGDALRGEVRDVVPLVRASVAGGASNELRRLLDSSEVSDAALARLEEYLRGNSEPDLAVRIVRAKRVEVLGGINAALNAPEYFMSYARNVGVLPGFRAWVFVMRPHVLSDGLAVLDWMDRAEEVYRNGSADAQAAFRREVETAIDAAQREFPPIHMTSALVECLHGEPTVVQVNGARRDLARIGIALRRSRMKHRAYPDSLAPLVPEFLDALPKDPFSGGDMKYRRDGDGFMVYSVGINGVNENGLSSGDKAEADDIVFRVSW